MIPAPELCITHAAAATPLALDLETTWTRLCAGESGIKPVTRFDASGLCCDLAACVPELNQAPGEESLLAALLDLLAPQLASWPIAQDALLFAASAKAGVDALPRCLDATTSTEQTRLAQGLLPHSLRKGLCSRLGRDTLSGEDVGAACASGTVAIIRGAQSILAGRCSMALILAADLVTPFTMRGFSALRALSSAPCRPFDRGRDGLTLGEGAAALLLMPLSLAKELKRPCLGLLRGWGMAADARHITAPARDGRGLVKAIQQALCRAGRGHVDAVCAHGTGTVYNDAMEITAFEQVFAAMPPVFSSKGALGHGMAASGALEAALCLQAMQHRRLPPTLGCNAPEPALAGLVGDACREFPVHTMLSCNSGFGGINAALILEHPELASSEGAWLFT